LEIDTALTKRPKGPTERRPNMSGLHESASAGDLASLRTALERGCKLADADPAGRTPLMQLVQAAKWAEAMGAPTHSLPRWALSSCL